MTMLKCLCKSYLRLFNAVIFILGITLAITSVSIYFRNDHHSNDPSQQYVYAHTITAVITGLLIASCAACTTSNMLTDNRCVLCLTAVFYLVVSLGLIVDGAVAGIVVTTTKDLADHIQTAGSLGLNGVQRTFNDIELGFFDACCGLGQSDRGECSQLYIVDDAVTDSNLYCYYDEDVYQTGFDDREEGDHSEVCEKFVQKKFCGPQTSFPEFTRNFERFMRDHLQGFEPICITIGSFIFLAFIGSMFLCCVANTNKPTVITHEYVILQETA